MNAYRAAPDLLDALGDATRRAIVEGLRDGERTVGDLAAGLPVSRPAVSQHLGVLRSAGIVTERAVGTRRYYRLDPAGLAAVRERIDAMWGAEPASAAPAPAADAAAAPMLEDQAAKPTDDTKAGRKKHKKKGNRK